MASYLPTSTTAGEAKEASEQVSIRLSNLLGHLHKDFKERFADCLKSEPLLQFVLNPFNADPEMISNTAAHWGLTDINFELEIIAIQEKYRTQAKAVTSVVKDIL